MKNFFTGLAVFLTASFLVAATTTYVDITGVNSGSTLAGGTGGGGLASPAGTDWIIGQTDFGNRFVLGASQPFYMGPFTFSVELGGTGSTSAAGANPTVQTDEAFGVRNFVVGSSAGAFYTLSMDNQSFIAGDGTIRIGARVAFEDIPVSGAEDYYYWIGFTESDTTTSAQNYALLGIDLTDNATNFVLLTHNGSSETATDTGIAIASDTWFNLEIELSPTAVTAWIDGAQVAQVSGVPAAASELASKVILTTRVGTPSATRNIYYDWAYLAYKPGTARGSISSGGPF